MVITFLLLLFLFIILGIPIAFVLALVGIAMLFYFGGGIDSTIIAQRVIDGVNSYSLLAIPFFILAGELMNRSGVTIRIIDFAMSLIGHIRGGLGYVVIISSVIFAGLSGSAVADTFAIGTVLIPMMAARGYDKGRATGLVVSSGIIGPIIPPSTGFIIFGVVSGTSIIKLFMAGIIPGVLLGISLAVTWAILTRKDSIRVTEKEPPKEILKKGIASIWGLVLPVVIIGGLRVGLFTTTEAGIIAVFYILFIGLFVYRELKFKDLYSIFLSTARTTGIVLLLVGTSNILAWFITTSNISNELIDLFGPLVDRPILLVLCISLLLFVVGMVMDTTAATLILVPILMPIVLEAGVDPVYFGVVFMLTLTIGLITPPVGVVLFAGMSISKINMGQALKGLWPFLVAETAVLLLIILFPEITIFSQNLFTK